MDGTIIGKGTFTQGATAVNQNIVIPSNVDELWVYNFTQAGVNDTATVTSYWQPGFGSKGIIYNGGGGHAVTANQSAANAFMVYDPSSGAINAINNGSTGVSGFTAANPSVVTVGSTTGMAAGNIVRFDTLNNEAQYSGIDFSAGYGTLTGTTFSLDYLNSTGATPATSGNWRIIKYNPLFYPRRRVATIIVTGTTTVVTTAVDHGFTVGQVLRFSVAGGSSVWGTFSNLNGQQAIVTAVDTATGVGHNTVTLGIDSTGLVGPAGSSYAATWAAITSGTPFTPIELVPVGEDTATSLSSAVAQFPIVNGVQIYNTQSGLLADSTVNTGYLGVTLAAGKNLPAGQASDVVFWKAIKMSYGGL